MPPGQTAAQRVGHRVVGFIRARPPTVRAHTVHSLAPRPVAQRRIGPIGSSGARAHRAGGSPPSVDGGIAPTPADAAQPSPGGASAGGDGTRPTGRRGARSLPRPAADQTGRGGLATVAPVPTDGSALVSARRPRYGRMTLRGGVFPTDRPVLSLRSAPVTTTTGWGPRDSACASSSLPIIYIFFFFDWRAPREGRRPRRHPHWRTRPSFLLEPRDGRRMAATYPFRASCEGVRMLQKRNAGCRAKKDGLEGLALARRAGTERGPLTCRRLTRQRVTRVPNRGWRGACKFSGLPRSEMKAVGVGSKGRPWAPLDNSGDNARVPGGLAGAGTGGVHATTSSTPVACAITGFSLATTCG